MAKDQTAALSPRKYINGTVCGLVKVHGDGVGPESDGNMEPSDLRCRQVILDFIEQFRTALNMKDINFLKTVLGADSLGNISSMDYKGNASTYLKTLIRVLKTNNKMIAKVDDIEVDQHEVKKIYMGSLFFFFGIVAIIMMKDTFSNYGTLLMIVLPKSISLLGNPV
jgi:hypothetical protein